MTMVVASRLCVPPYSVLSLILWLVAVILATLRASAQQLRALEGANASIAGRPGTTRASVQMKKWNVPSQAFVEFVVLLVTRLGIVIKNPLKSAVTAILRVSQTAPIITQNEIIDCHVSRPCCQRLYCPSCPELGRRRRPFSRGRVD